MQTGLGTPIPRMYASLALRGTAASWGDTHAAHPLCCQSLGWYSFSRKGCPQGGCMPAAFAPAISLQWVPGVLLGSQLLGNRPPVLLRLSAGGGLGCSHELRTPSGLAAPHTPAAFQGCSGGVGSLEPCLPSLPILCPLPMALGCPVALACLCAGGTDNGTWAAPAHRSHSGKATRHKPLAPDEPSSHGWAEPSPVPAAWRDTVPANGTGQPHQKSLPAPGTCHRRAAQG